VTTDIKTEGRPLRLFIGIPVYREPHPKHKESMDALLNSGCVTIKYASIVGDSLVDRARATLLAEYLKEKPGDWDYYIQFDDDISFDWQEIVRMLLKGRDVISGPYTYRKDVAAGETPTAVLRPIPTAQHDEQFCLEVEYAGTGCLAISDRALRLLCLANSDLAYWTNPDTFKDGQVKTYAVFQPIAVPQPSWGLDENRMIKKEYLSEDYAFCYRLRQMGYKIYSDLTVHLTHWKGDKGYTLSTQETDDGKLQGSGQKDEEGKTEADEQREVQEVRQDEMQVLTEKDN
jgi:hypothetical protein